MKHLFYKFLNANRLIAVAVGILSAMVFSFIISAIINLVLDYLI